MALVPHGNLAPPYQRELPHMDPQLAASSVLSLLAGIGIFLIACKLMSDNLESIGSEKLRQLFASASGSKLLGVGIGMVGTAAIQSSGATTVMVIGFVSAGIMTLAQAATIVFGANIGTTITAHIVALGLISGESVSTTVIFSSFTIAGALIARKAKSDTLRTVGGIITGFGMLFVGLSMMSDSMEGFAQLEVVRNFLASIKNPLLLIITGAILTAIIQSSSVMTSVVITMLVTSLITLDQGIFLTMGSNIGSCVVSIIASATSGADAKRTALIHLLFNVGGVILFGAIGAAIGLATGGQVSLGSIFGNAFPNAPQTQLAMFHTVFNVVAVIVALPLTEALVALVMRIIPDAQTTGQETETRRLHFVDENMLCTPAIAVAQVKEEIVGMAHTAMENFSYAMMVARTLDFSDLEQFQEREEELNFTNNELVRYIAVLSREKLSEADHSYLSKAFHSVSDLERIGDYSENIIEYAQALSAADTAFSPDELDEISKIESLVMGLFPHVIGAYTSNDRAELEQAFAIEDQVDEATENMEESYVRRFAAHQTSAEAGTSFLSLATDAERVADHLINVAKTVQALA